MPVEMPKIEKFRAHFRKRPSMYLGKACISNFENFLCGIMVAEYCHEPQENLFPYLEEFEKHLQKKYRNYFSSRKSFGLALRKAKNDDVEAFHLWMKWYDDFVGKFSHV